MRRKLIDNCHVRVLSVLAIVAILAPLAAAEEPGPGYKPIGKLKPRDAKQIESSNWSVGAETMDRDYTIYANWRQYLGPLGVKKARIQSGWAKTEREKGKYDWAWLDEIVLDMVAQGVEPWVCLCYGNPIYPGGGGTGLSGGLPASPEAKRAWETFVGLFVDRYGKHVDEWEIWNEPRGGMKTVDAYADLVARTAAVIRKRQPKARILVMAGGAFDLPFVDKMLGLLGDAGKLDLIDQVTYHPYSYNPDSVYPRVAELRKIIASYSKTITIRQGENGAPSKGWGFGALTKFDWDERRQAKWAVRRLLGDLGHDVPSSYFAICDMAYQVGQRGRDSDLRDDTAKLKLLVNHKGLLAINPDRTINHAKQAYRAVQNVTAVFDDTLKRIDDYPCKVEGGKIEGTFSTFGYRTAGGRDILTVWRDSDRPGDRPEMDRVTITIDKARFDRPVWVDMLGGDVYEIPTSTWTKDGSRHTFRDLPVHDSVVLIADHGDLTLTAR